MEQYFEEQPVATARRVPRPRGLCALHLTLYATLALAVGACGGGDDSVDRSAPTAVSTIGPAGGTLNGPDGVELVVPPGALSADTELRITRTSDGAPALQADGTVVTPTYEFTPHGLLFEQPVTIRMPFQPTAGAAAADVLMASPGGEWSSVGATVAGGKAEWQRISLSYGAAVTCVVPTQSTDPYACVWTTLGTGLSATPAGALQSLAGLRNWRVSAAAVLSFELRMSAAPDCTAPRLTVRRKTIGAGSWETLAEITPTLLPDPENPKRVRATHSHDLTLSHANNGTHYLSHSFQCTRPGLATIDTEDHVLRVDIPAPNTDVPPEVGTAPQDVTVTAPAGATFTAAGSGSPAPTLQWQRSADGGNSWADIAGATGSSYTTGATSAADNGARFRAVFSNRAGSLPSATATLTVLTRDTPLAEALPQADSLPGKAAAVAAASAGRFVAAWVVADPVTRVPTRIRASRYERASGWSPGIDIATVGTDVGDSLSVALGKDGTAVVAWVQPAAGKDSAWFVRQGAGGSWSNPALIENDNADNVRKVIVATDASGTATAVWNNDGAGRTFASRLDAGASAWSGPVELGLSNGGSIWPVMAMAADGRLLVAFMDFDRANNQRVMVANRWVPGTGWSGPVVLMAQSMTYIMTPGNAAIAGGHAAVVYQAVPGAGAGAGARTMVSRWSATGGWGAAEELPVGPVGSVAPTASRQVAIDTLGRTSVVWDQSAFIAGVPVSEVYFTEASPGRSFGALERLSPAGGYAAGPQIAADALGNLVSVWSDSFVDLRGVRRLAGGSWRPSVSWQTDPTGRDLGSAFALGPDGDAAMAWIESANAAAIPTVSVWSP